MQLPLEAACRSKVYSVLVCSHAGGGGGCVRACLCACVRECVRACVRDEAG